MCYVLAQHKNVMNERKLLYILGLELSASLHLVPGACPQLGNNGHTIENSCTKHLAWPLLLLSYTDLKVGNKLVFAPRSDGIFIP
jgi:hypothetical protein